MGVPDASRAQPWSAPRTLPESSDWLPAVAFSPSGEGIVVWSRHPDPQSAFGPDAYAAPLRPDGGAGAPRRIATRFSVGNGQGVAMHGRDRVIVSGTVYRRSVTHAGLASGSLASGLGPPRSPMPRGRISGMAVNRAGDVAVLVRRCEERGCGRSTPFLVMHRRGTRSGRPVRLDRPGRGEDGAVAIDDRGDAIAAWDRDGRIRARFRRGRAPRVGPVHSLGSSGPGVPELTAALGPGGAAVAWGSQDVDEGRPRSPYLPRVAVGGRTGGFTRARRLETVRATGVDGYVRSPAVRIAIVSGGRMLVAWTGGGAGQAFVVRAAQVSRRGVSRRRTVTPAGGRGELADLATSPRGDAILLWTGRTTGGAGGLFATVRPAGANAFAGAEPVSASDSVDDARLAISPRTGRAVAVWRDVGNPFGIATRDPVGP